VDKRFLWKTKEKIKMALQKCYNCGREFIGNRGESGSCPYCGAEQSVDTIGEKIFFKIVKMMFLFIVAPVGAIIYAIKAFARKQKGYAIAEILTGIVATVFFIFYFVLQQSDAMPEWTAIAYVGCAIAIFALNAVAKKQYEAKLEAATAKVQAEIDAKQAAEDEQDAIAEQIEKLGKRLKAGIITKEQYDKKVAELKKNIQ
jgi:hypothetical protein